jgi:hypothetical protein
MPSFCLSHHLTRCCASTYGQQISSWAAFGLSCLSLFCVIISTTTCSFVIDTNSLYYDTVEYGLFCFKGDGEKVSDLGSSLTCVFLYFSSYCVCVCVCACVRVCVCLVKFRYAEFNIPRPDTLVNAQWFGTAAFLAIAVAVIALGVVLVLHHRPTTPHHPPPPAQWWWAWCIARIAHFTALLCVISTFTMNADSFCESTCDGSTGSTLNAFNIVLLFAVMILTWITSARRRRRRGRQGPKVSTAAAADAGTAPPPAAEATDNDDDDNVETSPRNVEIIADVENPVVAVVALTPIEEEEGDVASTYDGTNHSATDSSSLSDTKKDTEEAMVEADTNGPPNDKETMPKSPPMPLSETDNLEFVVVECVNAVITTSDNDNNEGDDEEMQLCPPMPREENVDKNDEPTSNEEVSASFPVEQSTMTGSFGASEPITTRDDDSGASILDADVVVSSAPVDSEPLTQSESGEEPSSFSLKEEPTLMVIVGIHNAEPTSNEEASESFLTEQSTMIGSFGASEPITTLANDSGASILDADKVVPSASVDSEPSTQGESGEEASSMSLKEEPTSMVIAGIQTSNEEMSESFLMEQSTMIGSFGASEPITTKADDSGASIVDADMVMPSATVDSEPSTQGKSGEEALSESCNEEPSSMVIVGSHKAEPAGNEEVSESFLMEQSTMIGSFGASEPITARNDDSGDESWESLPLVEPSTPAGTDGASESSAPDDSSDKVLASFHDPSMMCISTSEESFTEDDSSDELLDSFQEEPASMMMMIGIKKTGPSTDHDCSSDEVLEPSRDPTMLGTPNTIPCPQIDDLGEATR